MNETLKSDSVPTEQEFPEAEAIPAIPEEEMLEEGEVAPMELSQIQENEALLVDQIKLSKPPIKRSGAAQLARMINIASSSDVSPEDVAKSYNSDGEMIATAHADGLAFEQSTLMATDKAIVANPNIPLERRVESMKALNSPSGYTLNPNSPLLGTQYIEGMVVNEANRYGAGQAASGGVDALNKLMFAKNEQIPPAMTPSEWRSYVHSVSGEPLKESPKIDLDKAIADAQTPEELQAAISAAANYTGEEWKFFSSQGAKLFIPLIDQYYLNELYDVFQKNGLGYADTDRAGLFTHFLGAGGASQRDLIEQWKNASPLVQKKVMRDLLARYDGESGMDVYIADLLNRAANGNPNLFMDTFFTVMPLAGAPGDIAFAAGLGAKVVKGSAKAGAKVAKAAIEAPLGMVGKRPPAPAVDSAIRHATQTTGDTIEAAAVGNKTAQEFLGMTDSQAAMHVTPGAMNFTDESWYGSKAVINQTNQKAARAMTEVRQVFGDYADEIMRMSPDELIGTISSHMKASRVAMLAKGASKVVKTDGGFSYEAVYRAADGNGFDSLKDARVAAKQFGSRREVVKYAYESADGTVRVLEPPASGLSKEESAAYRADMKALKSNPAIKWSIIRKGSVALDTPDEVMFGQFGKEMVGDGANALHRVLDTNSTANIPLNGFLNRVSGEQARLINVVNGLFTGRTTRFLARKDPTDVNYLASLSGREQDALSKGMKIAEEWEDEAALMGKARGIPLSELQKIPGWNENTTNAFIEYINNSKVTWHLANTNYRRQAIAAGFKQYVSASTGKRVNGKALTRFEWTDDLHRTGSLGKDVVGLDGKVARLDVTATAKLFSNDSPARIIRLHQPFWAGKRYVTHQIIDVEDMVEEALPPVMLNARTFYYPKVHTGRFVVQGKTELGEWIAIGMAKNAEYARDGVAACLKDPRLTSKFVEINQRPISEMAERGVERGEVGFDAVRSQLDGVVYGARNDELAYFGDEGTDGLTDPIEALFSTVNKLAVGKKDSEVAYARTQLTKFAKEEGLLDESFVGILTDEASLTRLTNDSSKAKRVDAYKDSFRNINAMVEVDNKMMNAYANTLNKLANELDKIVLDIPAKDSLIKKGALAGAEGFRTLVDTGKNPFTPLRFAYTRLLITGKPLRQGAMQAFSAFINLYRPQALIKGWRASAALDSAMSAMDDVAFRGDADSLKVLDVAQQGLADALGISKAEAGEMAKHWRDMGGYDAINSHLYAQSKYKALQHTNGAPSYVINKLKILDDKIYGTQGRLGFEVGERYAQRVAFLTEVADDLAKGKASLKSKKYIQDAMGRAGTMTGMMRSEFRINPGKGYLTLAATFITYPMRMSLLALPRWMGGSIRLTASEKIRLASAQGLIFGTAAYPIATFAEKGFEMAMQELAPPEVLEQYQALVANAKPARDGFLGEHLFNTVMGALTQEETDYDLSSTFGMTTGLPQMFDLVSRSADGNMMDVLLNMTLFKSTRIAEGLTVANMMFHRVFDGHTFDDPGVVDASLATEFASIALPQLDSAWLSYIAFSQNAMVSKKGTPTGEAYSASKAFLKNGIGLRDISDELAYKTIEKTRQAMYNKGLGEEKSEASKRADLVYKLLVSQVAMSRAGGNKALDNEEMLKNNIFNVMQSLIGFLPKDEMLMLQQALMKKHEQMASRQRVEDYAPESLAEALYGGNVPNGKAQDLFDYLKMKYPQTEWTPELRYHMEKARDHISTVDEYNQAGE